MNKLKNTDCLKYIPISFEPIDVLPPSDKFFIDWAKSICSRWKTKKLNKFLHHKIHYDTDFYRAVLNK